MKTLAIIALLCLGIFLVIGMGVAYGEGEDTDDGPSVVTLTIPHAVVLEIDNDNSSKTLVQDDDTETDFDLGRTIMPPATPKLTVSANRSWVLKAKATAWTGGPYPKLVTDLQLKHGGLYVQNAFNAYKSLTLADQTIASNAIGVFDEVYNCQYQILLDYTKDLPGTYSSTVTYTLTTSAT